MHSQAARSLAALACASPVGEVAQAELAAAVAAKGVDTPVVQAHLGRTAQKNSFPSQSGYLAYSVRSFMRGARPGSLQRSLLNQEASFRRNNAAQNQTPIVSSVPRIHYGFCTGGRQACQGKAFGGFGCCHRAADTTSHSAYPDEHTAALSVPVSCETCPLLS